MSARLQDEQLPRPFYDDGLPRPKRAAARALWQFHVALLDARAPALDGDDLRAYFEAESQKAGRGEPLKVVPADVAAAAYLASSDHKLPLDLMATQVYEAHHFKGPIRFADNRAINQFIDHFAGAHAALIAHLAGASGSWQLRYVGEFARGMFWVGRLMTLPRDAARDWIFIPEADLEQSGVSIEQLRAGQVDEKMRRLLWKQTIRAKDAFAQSEPLPADLPRRYAGAFKRWWFGGLEVLNEIVRRDYDVFSRPVRLSRYQRAQARVQARFGRTTFRSH